jgi:hypothetical protein
MNIDQVLNENTLPITKDHINQLQYTSAVLKEALRLYPPVPITARNAPYDMEFDGTVFGFDFNKTLRSHISISDEFAFCYEEKIEGL